MSNHEIDVAMAYHEATKHSYISVRSSGHYMDWSNRPKPYKTYPDAPVVKLPEEFPVPEVGVIDVLRSVSPPSNFSKLSDLKGLAEILFYSAGLTRKIRYGEEFFDFRAAASAGALYPVEIYVVSGDMQSLDAGVYHFMPKDFSLHKLREGDFRSHLSSMAAKEEAVHEAQLALVMTAIFWRSAWKYQARSYRYCYWDAGTILANTLAVCAAERLGARVVAGFVDDEVNKLLGVDGKHEAALCILPIGKLDGKSSVETETLSPVKVDAEPVFMREVVYPEIHRLHESSRLQRTDEVAEWRRRSVILNEGLDSSRRQIRPIIEYSETSLPLGKAVRKRGSTRRFAREPIPFASFSAILASATEALQADFLSARSKSLVEIFLICNAVADLSSGSYLFDRGSRCLTLLKDGGFRKVAGYLCLEQALAADASAVVFFMSDLRRVLEGLGNRGYRAVQLEAGILGGRMYLAAYGLGLGATGLTFFDDDVTEFFSPESDGKSPIFVVALGKPSKS